MAALEEPVEGNPHPSRPSRFDVLIVGGGHAGAQAAMALRQAKFGGSIAIVGDEPDLPYERPPLSKEYLAGEKSFERLLIRPPRFWSEREVTMLLGQRVDRVDATAHLVFLTDGTTIGYGNLVWATGGRARRLPCSGHDLAGVHTVRTRADVDRMMTELSSTRRVIVIGGGYIGLEAAAVLTKLGKQVVLLEALDRVLARVAGEPLSRFFEAEHRARGVEVRLAATVDAILGDGDRVVGVRLIDGEIIAGEMVIVGIGIIPAVEPLLAAGAAGDNGVAVDAQCRTSLPDVFAIGDCALHTNHYADGRAIRLESVQNAGDQASVVAKTITGLAASYDAVPWFWSNQFDLRLQTAGISIGFDETVTRGDPRSRSFSIVYLRGGKVVALDCVNAAKDFVQGKALVAGGLRLAPSALADATRSLKEMAAETAEATIDPS